MSPPTRKAVFTATFAFAWLVALTGGLAALIHYENLPGRVGVTPESWPAATRIARSNDKFTLVMLAHPRCPCTRASVAELAQVMAHVHGKVNAYVLLMKPRNSAADWDDTGLRHSAEKIPNVTILTDVDGEEAQRFGAETSGHTVLFDRAGKRLFSGGITASRGHEGDNAGESAVVALVNAQSAVRSTSVFGCALSSHPQAKATPCPN